MTGGCCQRQVGTARGSWLRGAHGVGWKELGSTGRAAGEKEACGTGILRSEVPTLCPVCEPWTEAELLQDEP